MPSLPEYSFLPAQNFTFVCLHIVACINPVQHAVDVKVVCHRYYIDAGFHRRGKAVVGMHLAVKRMVVMRMQVCYNLSVFQVVPLYK